MAPIVLLLKTVFEAILEVFLLCLAGYILSRRGVLDKKTQKQINRLNVSLFTPALLFSKVAFSLTPAKLRELWIIPIVFFVVTGASMVIAYLLSLVFRLNGSQKNFAIAAAMFMNSNSLPIALMQSLVVTVPNLKWDEDDTKSAMLGRALSYLVLSSTLGMVLRWSFGVHLLSKADPEGRDEDNPSPERDEHTYVERYTDNPETQPLLVDLEHDAHPTMIVTPHDQPQSTVLNDDEVHPKNIDAIKQDHLHVRTEIPVTAFYSFPNTPSRSYANLTEANSSSSSATLALPFDGNNRPATVDLESDSDETLLLPSSTHHDRILTAPPMSLPRRAARQIWKLLREVNSFMTVPLWAALLSLIVVLIPPLQHSLDYHMQPIKGALTAAGNCSIPLTLVVLGAYFYHSPEKHEASGEDGPENRHVVVENGSREAIARSGRSSSFVSSVRSVVLRLSRLHRWPAREGKDGVKKSNIQPGETNTVIVAVLSRMVLTPLLLLPLMTLGARYDIPKIFDDPVFIVSTVLLISSPPALTLAQITQAASGDAFERLISRTVFWSYCVVTPPATILYVVIGLLIANL